MALAKNFYNEIFEKEQQWIEYIEKNLLNCIYCNLTLKPFYETKRKTLEEEYDLTKNDIIEQIIIKINDLINTLSYLNYQYLNHQTPNLKSLLPLFLINQMNNVVQKDNKDTENRNESIDKLKKEKKDLQDQINNYARNFVEVEDYVYDDFPEEVAIKK